MSSKLVLSKLFYSVLEYTYFTENHVK